MADVESGQIQNAKRAGWASYFGFRANLTDERYVDPSRLRITLPDGEVVTGEAGNRDEKLSGAFGRGVTLVSGGGFSTSAPYTCSRPPRWRSSASATPKAASTPAASV